MALSGLNGSMGILGAHMFGETSQRNEIDCCRIFFIFFLKECGDNEWMNASLIA